MTPAEYSKGAFVLAVLQGFGAGLAVTAAGLLLFGLFVAHFVMHCTACLGSLTPFLAMIVVGAGLWRVCS